MASVKTPRGWLPTIRYIPQWFIVVLISCLFAGCGSSRIRPDSTPVGGSRTPLPSSALQDGRPQASPEKTFPPPVINPRPSNTEGATAAVAPSATPTPVETPTGIPPSPDPTGTLTEAHQTPDEAIQILGPGPASKVVSPILFRVMISPGPTGLVEVALLGEDGRLLMRDVRTYDTSPGQMLNLGMNIKYEIAAVAEAGRIQISTVDEYGRLLALASVHVILLSIGDSDINPAGDGTPSIVIQQPDPGAVILGGTAHVAGLARLQNKRPLMVDFKTADGRIIGTRQVNVTEATAGYVSFSIDVPYTVADSTPALLSVWAQGDRIPGIVYLSSLEVMLSP